MARRARMNLLLLILVLASRNIKGSRCFFPRAWHGDYFHLGYHQPLQVVNDTISQKGKCVENFGSHFVLEDEEYGEKCWKCLTIYRKHQNVLSYKESYCETYFDTFESLCSNIAGDSPMHTMFRKDAQPVKCPFKGPFLFSYSKGGSGLNHCGHPKSYLDSCADNRRLQLNFQACIDVAGSESGTEELECLATWSEGSKHYLVAEMDREHVFSDESKYRCFVYSKAGKGDNRTVKMAQSLAATCTGLWSPVEGYRTFQMDKVSGPRTRCELPGWMTENHHSWSSLDASVQLHINSGGRSFKLRNLQDSLHPEDSHVTCQQLERGGERGGTWQAVTYVKSGCDSGFMCAAFSAQTSNVIKVQFGHKARLPSEACSDLYFSPAVSRSLLLVSTSHKTSVAQSASACPLSGRYTISPHSSLPLPSLPCSSSELQLSSGCGASTMVVEQQCGLQEGEVSRTEYSCHSSWSGPGKRTQVIISSSPSSPSSSSHRRTFLCLSYSESQGRLSSEDCESSQHSTFNISLSGPCVQALSSVSRAPSLPSLHLLRLLALLSLLSGLP